MRDSSGPHVEQVILEEMIRLFYFHSNPGDGTNPPLGKSRTYSQLYDTDLNREPSGEQRTASEPINCSTTRLLGRPRISTQWIRISKNRI